MSRYMNSNQHIGPNPKSMSRPKTWTDEVEEVYRFQLAGFRDESEYIAFRGNTKPKTEAESEVTVDRWPHNGYVKKLQRKDGYFYYYNKTRECPDKEVHKCKIYAY